MPPVVAAGRGGRAAGRCRWPEDEVRESEAEAGSEHVGLGHDEQRASATVIGMDVVVAASGTIRREAESNRSRERRAGDDGESARVTEGRELAAARPRLLHNADASS